MRKIPTKTTQIVASRESPVLAAALHTQCPLGALTCGICQERRGIWWRHHVQQLEKSGSKSVGCTQGAGRRGVQGGVHDRRGARTTTKPKAPEIIMTPAWQLGQRRNICLVTQHENIFPLSSRPTRGPAGLSRVPCMGFFLPVHANETWIRTSASHSGRALLTQHTMRWPRGDRRLSHVVSRATTIASS